MKRDGACTSLWQNAMPDYQAKHQNFPENSYDVVIVGGGVTGITTALQLQKQGKKCVVAEAHSLCFGTTGGTTSHLNTFLDTSYDIIESDFGEDGAQLVARATKMALNLYKKNIQEYNQAGYAEKSGFVYSQDAKQTEQLDKIYEASVKGGVHVSYVESIPVPIPFQKAIEYKGQAQVHATRYVYSLARAFEELGGVILQNCKVEGFQNKNRLVVETSLGNVYADYLIYATHIPPGINLLHFRCAPYRSYAMAVKLKDNHYPDGLSYDMYDPYHYYRTQEIDGEQYLIVGGEDHKTAHEEDTESCFRQLEDHIRQYFNVESIPFKWSSQYFEPSDGLAYIGHLPGNPENVLVATGYSGNGMTYSHVAAITLTDLVTKGKSEFASLFNPNRVKPVAGFASFVKENADVVAKFVGMRLSPDKLVSLTSLTRGEGRVVKYDGEHVAVYRDESDALHALSPVCSHAKCIVGWNPSEKTWDCPCHGARYSIDGEVLTGPARHGLEKIELKEPFENPYEKKVNP